MALIVQKYGGSSVKDLERIKAVAQRIKATRDKGHQVVVVVSARGGVTNRLVADARALDPQPDDREMDMLLSVGEQETIALTGIEDLSDRMVDSLSGGARQRVWLAMLIAQNAKLLLLDEPISALDPAHQVGVLSLIHRISVEKELTVLIVLHDVNLAARFCDRLIALKGGRVIAEGTPGEFMTAERLTRIYDVKMGVFPNPDLEGSIAYVRA